MARRTTPILYDSTSPDIAWAAGLAEGEGSISLGYPRSKATSPPRVSFQLMSTDRDVVDRFREVARVGSICGPYRQRDHHKPGYKWCCSGNRAIDFLIALRPFFGTRRGARIVEVVSIVAPERLSELAAAA